MIYGYIRVSTNKQTTENQRFEILNFSEKNQLKIDKWIEETVSATKDISSKKLGRLISKLKKDDIVITSELSRLGRNLFQVMNILHRCMLSEAKIWTIKDNYRLGVDIQSKVLAFAFALSAELERNLISQRTKEALQRVKAEGKVLGYPRGQKNNVLKLTNKINTVRKMLKSGHNYSAIARKLKVHRATVREFVKREQIKMIGS